MILRHEYEYGGFAGLARAIQKLTSENQKDNNVGPSSNHGIIKDEDIPHLMMILASMSPESTGALISDLCDQIANETQINNAFTLQSGFEKILGKDHTSSDKLSNTFRAPVTSCADDEVGQAKFSGRRPNANTLKKGHYLVDTMSDARLVDMGIALLDRAEGLSDGSNPQLGDSASVQNSAVEETVHSVEQKAERTDTEGSTSQVAIAVANDGSKIARLEKLDRTTEQELQKREAQIEQDEKEIDERWNKIQKRMKRLEEVVRLSIARKAVKAADLAPDSLTTPEESIFSRCRMESIEEETYEDSEERESDNFDTDIDNLEDLRRDYLGPSIEEDDQEEEEPQVRATPSQTPPSRTTLGTGDPVRQIYTSSRRSFLRDDE